ncbi:MAG TPA: glycosyltransferase [Gemmatimonadales bacterium]|nr:glycosyltransferase [Gemmatimonadales bacterium]
MREPDLSLVIPAYNEERFLPRLLASLAHASTQYAATGGSVEFIVADNQSTDGTARVAAAGGAKVVRVEERRIAAARNGGAAAARGRNLAFLDADTVRVHPETFAAVTAALADPRVVGGATGCTLERWSVGLAITYAMMMPLIWVTGFDTGLVFCRREDFVAVGGYPNDLRLAEDLAFLSRLWKLGRRRGQRLRRLRHHKVVASTRKFDEHGDWHFFGLMARGPALLFGARFDRFADRYWYRPNR